MVVRTRDKLSRSGARVLGVLINNLSAPGRGYGGYYPYKGYDSYGYGGEPKGEEASAAAKVALRG